MDISRLPLAPLARPATSTYSNARQAGSAGGAVPVEPSRPRPKASVERVVQGELLHKERTPYQSTRAYIDERTMDRTHPADHKDAVRVQSRSAISQYLNNTRPETVSELARGKAVNFYV